MTTCEQKIELAKTNLDLAMTYMTEYMKRLYSVESDISVRNNAKMLCAIMEANPTVLEYFTAYTSDEMVDVLFADVDNVLLHMKRVQLFPYYRNEKEYTIKTLEQKSSCEGINKAPSCSGLYFIGQINYNRADKQLYYWVKVGKSVNIKSRMNGYKTSLTMMDNFDYLPLKNDNKLLSMVEEQYHLDLANYAIAKCAMNDEWFLVTAETYEKMEKEGFKFFEK